MQGVKGALGAQETKVMLFPLGDDPHTCEPRQDFKILQGLQLTCKGKCFSAAIGMPTGLELGSDQPALCLSS